MSSAALRQPPRRFGALRTGVFRTVEVLCTLLGGRGFYRRFFLSEGRFDQRHEVLEISDLPRDLVGFRIVHLSDFHAGPFLGRGDLKALMDVAGKLEPDLVVLTGDFITRDADEAALLIEDLSCLRATHGVFAVLGNHDYRGRQEARIARSLASANVDLLRNATRRIECNSAVLAIVGLEDLEEGRELDLDAARAGLREGDVEIVLCHNPGGVHALKRSGCAAVFSGHTHGRQIDLPVLRTLGPNHPGIRVQHGPTTLIVSRGVGVVGVPLRIRARAEIVLVELRAEPRD